MSIFSGEAQDVGALLHAYPENELPADALGRLGEAIADRAAEISPQPWSLLHSGQLPRILLAWASKEQVAASAWVHDRLNQPSFNEGVKLLQAYLVLDEDTGRTLLDAERLSHLVRQADVSEFLDRFAHTRSPEVTEVGLAMRATPAERWSH